MGASLGTGSQVGTKGKMIVAIDNTDPKKNLEPMTLPEKSRIIATMKRVSLLYPGPAGEILNEHLETWKEFGYKLGATARTTRFIQQVWATPLPDEVEPAKPSDEWTHIP